MFTLFVTKMIIMTLTFDPVYLKSIGVPSLSTLNIESSVINSFHNNEQKPCLYFSHVTIVTLTFNLVSPKSIGVMSSPRPISEI